MAPTARVLVALVFASVVALASGLRLDESLFAPFMHAVKTDDARTRDMLILRGVAEGFIGDAVPDMDACVKDEVKVATDAAALAAAFKKQDGDSVRKSLGQLGGALAESFSPCRAAYAEVARLETALAALQHPLAFSFVAGKNLAVNHVQVFDEVKDASSKWQSGDFEGFGRDVGDALALIVDGADRMERNRPVFLEWALKHGQPYATIGLAQGVTAAEASGADADAQRREFELRLSVFTSNLKVAEELSAKDLGTASYGASPFAAMTVEEFTSTRLQARPARLKGDDLAKSCLANGAISPPPPTVAAGAAPASFDWREKGAVTPVRDQSACGSCWAFSTAENIEGQWAIAKKELVVLSPQDIVDCSHGCSPEGIYGNVCNSGCQGGWPWSAYMDIIKEGGIASDAAYPYTAVAGECAFKGKAEATAIISNYTCLPSDEAFIKDYLVSHGPLSVALDARFLMLYTGGVSNPPLCSQEELDHAVLLVGYGTEAPPAKPSADEPSADKVSADPVDYWLVKNSWTAAWGEAGYFRIARGGNACGIANAVSSAILTVPMSPLTPSGKGKPSAPATAAPSSPGDAAISFAQRISASLRKRATAAAGAAAHVAEQLGG